MPIDAALVQRVPAEELYFGFSAFSNKHLVDNLPKDLESGVCRAVTPGTMA
jgi:hypothetical protein